MQNRKKYLDYIRVLACLGVVATHCTGGAFWHTAVGSKYWFAGLLFIESCRWCVPLFFMISGALMLDISYKMTYPKLLKKIIKLIFFGFFAQMLFLIICAYVDKKDTFFICAKDALVQLVFEGNVGIFWFIFALVGIYLWIPILRLFIKYGEKRDIQYLVCFFLLLFSVFRFQINDQEGFSFLNQLYNNDLGVDFVTCLEYFLCGYYLSNLKPIKEHRKNKMLLLCVFFLLFNTATIVNVYKDSVQKGVGSDYYGQFSALTVAVSSICLFILIKEIKIYNNDTLNKMILKCAKATLWVYGLHNTVILIWTLNINLYNFTNNAILVGIIILAVSFFFPIILFFFVGKFKKTIRCILKGECQ